MFDAEKLRALNFAMIDYYTGMPKYIQHFEKVHAFSSMIAQEEGLDEDTRFILEAAALVHDIGIKPSKEKYGSSAGQYQQIEGPAPAGEMMKKLGFSGDVIARVQGIHCGMKPTSCPDQLAQALLIAKEKLAKEAQPEA